MFINLAKQGIKRVIGPPESDIMRVREYHPEVLEKYDELKKQWGDYIKINSGYRDKAIGKIKNSPHMFAIALDLAVGNTLKQIELGKMALDCGFCRVGLYPCKGIIHVDIADDDWIKRYHGAPFWVSIEGAYWGQRTFEAAAKIALEMSTLGGD